MPRQRAARRIGSISVDGETLDYAPGALPGWPSATVDVACVPSAASILHGFPEKAPKGKYFLKASISSTMGPGVPVDVAALDPASPRFFREESS